MKKNKKISSLASRLARRQRALYNDDKITVWNSAENIQTLFDIVSERKNNIEKSALKLGIIIYI